jgi:hypothetical protein
MKSAGAVTSSSTIASSWLEKRSSPYLADLTQPISLAWDGHYTDTGFEWLTQPLVGPLGHILSR